MTEHPAEVNDEGEPQPAASGHLTREQVEAAFARLHEPPRMAPERARQELALIRWLDEQPPGTAGKLLNRMYGESEGGDD